MPRTSIVLVASFGSALCTLVSGCSTADRTHPPEWHPLTVVAIGDVGESGSVQRATAMVLNDMFSGRHDGGRPDAVLYLGDNFYPIGLNGPAEEVESLVRSVLGPFRPTLEGLGRGRVHAVAGNHEYYARNVIQESLLFGLINIAAGPVGLSERGNERARAISWWSYHSGMPGDAVYPIYPGAADSVQFIFYDSALPLRTEPASWRPALDSLRRLLEVSADRAGIIWRVLCQHHPWFSLGPHGGYSYWDEEVEDVAYLSNCDKDTNAVRWFLNSIDPEDLCAEKYRAQLDSLRSVIGRAGAKIHLVLSGHDHSLQVLAYPETGDGCPSCPTVQVISGAGSDPALVRLPRPPNEFTSAIPGRRGKSHAGFAQLRFTAESVQVVFFNASGELIDMGGGAERFFIDRDGRFIQRNVSHHNGGGNDAH